MTLGPGIEPGPHWREASVITTAPSLLLLGPGPGTNCDVNSFQF